MTHVPKHTATRVAARYLSGRSLDGIRRTDSGFFRRGSKALPPYAHASRWALLPGWQRAAWRVGAPLALAGEELARWTHPTETAATAGTVAAGGLAYGTYRARRAWRLRQHRKNYLVPLHRHLGAVLGVYQGTPEQWLDVTADFDREDVQSRIWLPRDLPMTADLKRGVRDVISAKLGLSDPDYAWHTIGARPYVAFTPAPKPPGKLQWGAVAEAARNAPDHAPIIGIGPRNVLVDIDLDAESPHLLVSAGTGGGKSVLIRTVLSQVLERGAGAVILDFKRHSHAWAKDLPGVLYCRSIDEIHNALVALGIEGDARNLASDGPNGYTGPRLFVVCEEMNATIFKLQAYWEQIREKSDPKTSPAIAGLRDVLFMGRAVRMHVMAVAQMMTARTLGGPEARENFAVRCITRATNNAWKMLAPEVQPIPRRTKTVGRWHIVKAGEALETQVAFQTDQEAADWARSGVTNPASVLATQTRGSQAERPETVPAPLPVGQPATEPLVGLRDALEQLPGPELKLDYLRKLRQRDRRFPHAAGRDGSEDLYRLEELVSWKKTRDAVRVVNGKAA